MKVLVACECSGQVRDAFAARGHNAWSCDLKPSEVGGKHLQCDVLSILYNGWDLMIAHPDCTDLTVAGARWFDDPRFNKREGQRQSIAFVKTLWAAPIPRVAIENPVGILSTVWMKPTQYIDPTQFGHGGTKKTCLWLRGLPLLTRPSPFDTPVLEKLREGNLSYVHAMGPSETRKADRARTLPNIAWAMAQQWG